MTARMVKGLILATLLCLTASAVQAQAPAGIDAALKAAHDKYKNIKEGKNADYIPALAKVDSTLHELEDDIESHMSRGLTMLSNAVQNQRSGIAECRSMLAALKARDEAMSLHDPAALTPAGSSASGSWES